MGAGPIRVLVCDDDEALVTTLEWFLAQAEFEVVSTTSGREALAILDRQAIDLVLLDLMMPEMTGQQVLRQIKANPRTQRMPVVILTAVDDDQAREECQMLGASEYLVKPVEVGALRKVIQRAMSGQMMMETGHPRASAPSASPHDDQASEPMRRSVKLFVRDVAESVRQLRRQLTLALARDPRSAMLRAADDKAGRIEALLKELEATTTHPD